MPTPFRVGMEIVSMHGHAKQRGHATQVRGHVGGMPTPFRVGMESGRMLTQRHSVSMPPKYADARIAVSVVDRRQEAA